MIIIKTGRLAQDQGSIEQRSSIGTILILLLNWGEVCELELDLSHGCIGNIEQQLGKETKKYEAKIMIRFFEYSSLNMLDYIRY